MLSFLWDCLPLFAIISPIAVDFTLLKTKSQWMRNQKTAWEKFQTIISISLATIACSCVLIFLAAIMFFYDIVMIILIFIHMAAVFAFYKLFTRVRNEKKTWGKVRSAILIGLTVAIGGFLTLPLIFSFDLTKLCLTISTPITDFIFYKFTIRRLRNQERAGLTVRVFLSVCLIAVGSIVVFPGTNFWFSLVAEGIKLSAMERFKGASIKTFVAVFGQPDGQSENQLHYFHVPCYSYDLPDDDIAVVIENGKIKACISH